MSVDIIFDLVFMATLFGGAIVWLIFQWRKRMQGTGRQVDLEDMAHMSYGPAGGLNPADPETVMRLEKELGVSRK